MFFRLTDRSRIFKTACVIAGIIVVLASIYAIANIRLPVGDAADSGINSPGQWQTDNFQTFHVGTYNIHRAIGQDGNREINRIASSLKANSIAGLQEVNGATLSGAPDQAQQLGELLNMGWLFAPAYRRLYGQEYGNALLSRFKVTSWRRQRLPSPVDSTNRNFIVANVQIGDRALTIINAHIDAGNDREIQLERVIEEFDRHSTAILLGDFNTRRKQSPLRELLGNSDITDAIAVALGKETPPWTVEWILTRGLKVLGGKFKDYGPSDHPMYAVEVQFVD
jgi:endonuclease/exonuclease/phosphatase family metal-dependent hydrolase